MESVPLAPEVLTKPLLVKEPNFTPVKEPAVSEAVPSVIVPNVPVPVVVKLFDPRLSAAVAPV